MVWYSVGIMRKPDSYRLIVTACFIVGVASSFYTGKTFFPRIETKIKTLTFTQTQTIFEKDPTLKNKLKESLRILNATKSELKDSKERERVSDMVHNMTKSKLQYTQQEVINRDMYMSNISFLWDPRRQEYVEMDLSFQDIQNIKNSFFHEQR